MEFGILGPLEVRDGARAVALGGLKPRALLAILLLNANRVVTSARLIDLLWGDEAPERAAHSLQVQISQLRKLLEPNRRASEFSVLVSQPPGYMLHVSEEHVDAQRFERLAAAARQARAAGDLPASVDRLSEALALWRGTPLADVAAEPFAIPEVARLTELRLRAIEDRIDARLGLGQHADLIAELESLVAEHPLRERLCAQLMLALYRGGRQAEASDLYYRTRQRLVDELGMEPGPALQALLKDIVRQESALQPAARRTGPAPAPPVRRGLCPILIGRESELQRLQQTLTPTHSPEGKIVLLNGEAGIGKTRFASEAHQRAVAAGMEVLWGGCSEAELALPYLPFVEAIGNYLATIDNQGLKRRLGPLSRELARLFPQLEEDVPITPTAIDPGQARLRLFEAILALLRVAAEPGGLLLVVDDAHWADASTRELLDYLARRLRQSNLTMLVTYRRDEVVRGHPLHPYVQAWERAGLTTTVELHPLSAEGVAGMLGAIFGKDEVNGEFRDFMHARTDGNPFVLEEMVKSAIDKGDIFRTEVGWERKDLAEFTIPVTVRGAILQRFRRLEKEHRVVISLAAVLGETFAYPELRAISELPEQTVMAALRESVTQQLVEAESGQHFRFHHALTREAVYQDLLVPERVALHARAGEALEALSSQGEERYAAAAHHYLLAENFRKAFQFHVLAAQAARRIYAVEEAIRHYSAALEGARSLELPELELTDIRLLRGIVHAEAGHAADARADFEAVLQGARMHADARTEMRALSELGFLLAGAADYRQAIVRLQDSLRIAEGLDDKTAQVNVLSRLSIAYTNRLRLDRAIAYGRQAERLARELGSDAARALAMDALLLAAVSVGDFVTADSIAPELIAIHRAQGNLWYLQFAIFQWCYASMGRGDWRQAVERVDEALAINRQIGDRGNEPIYHAAHCWIHRTTGEFQMALLAGRRAVRLAEELGHPEWLAWAPFELGATLVEVGLTEEAMPLLEHGMNTAERVGAMNHLIQCTGYLAWAETIAGNAHAADVMRKRGEALLSEIVAPPGGAFLQGIHAYTGLARACLALGEDRTAEALLSPIVSAAEASGWQHPIAEASLLLGRVLAAHNDVGGAEALLLRALAVAMAAHLDGIRWQAHAALAQLYNQTGRRELGTTEADRARVMVGQLAERIEDGQTRERFLRGASESIQSRLWEVRA